MQCIQNRARHTSSQHKSCFNVGDRKHSLIYPSLYTVFSQQILAFAQVTIDGESICSGMMLNHSYGLTCYRLASYGLI
jgi:hypothetical protein